MPHKCARNSAFVYLCQLTREQSFCLVHWQHFLRHPRFLCPMLSFSALSWATTGVGETRWGDLEFAEALLYVACNEQMMHLTKLLRLQTNKTLRPRREATGTMKERRPQCTTERCPREKKIWPQRDCSLRVEPPPEIQKDKLVAKRQKKKLHN